MDTNTNIAFNIHGSVRLGPRRALLLASLIESHPSRQSWQDLSNRMYDKDEKVPAYLASQVSWLVTQLRRDLRPLRWTILSEFGVGYYLKELKS